MLAPFLWLNPGIATGVLKTTSQLLKGEVPSPADKLSSLLGSVDADQCEGLLKDSGLRKTFAGSLGSIKEISDSSAAAIVDAFGAALEKQVKEIKAKAEAVAKALPKKSASGGAVPTFSEVCAALPKGQEPGEVLKLDWVLWHSSGHAQDPKAVPALKEDVLRDRLALAACAGSGPIAQSVLALQVLDNLDAYVAWEIMMKGSQPSSAGLCVTAPFNKDQAKALATRRVLLNAGLPVEVAAKAAAKATSGGGLASALKELASSARSAAVIPMYTAPPAPKQPKEKGEGAAKDKSSGGAASGGKPSTPAAAGAIGKLHGATATQELQWALLAYQMRPRTTLGEAALQSGGASQQAAARGTSGGTKAEQPAGFAGVWAPVGATLPPGHTPYSWNHEEAKGMQQSFATTWEPTGQDFPPGHTPYSWEKVLGGAAGASTATSSSAPAPEAKAKAKAQAAAPAAKAKAAAGGAASGDAPAEGSEEAALCKLDFRCGRIRECGRVPDADSLYLLKVDVGEEQPRQVVSSLVKHYKEDDLKDRQVVVYCNIKPGKMRGFESQAMVLAATKDKGADNEVCELLAPPKGAKEGTRVVCGNLEAGSTSANVSTKNISKVWGQVQPLLQTNGKKEATFKGTVFTMPEGPVTVGSLTGVGIY
mmetsp:Transcript_101249/g.253806  ORF Transcript_101249/g.253806 Transcript_101249/m.253806 type:complete len:650 (-) Transcript_101249:109-2058(-)